MADPDLYRTKDEIEHWRERDPIALLEARLRKAKLLTDDDLASLEAEIAAELDEAIAVAEAGALGAGRGPDEGRLHPERIDEHGQAHLPRGRARRAAPRARHRRARLPDGRGRRRLRRRLRRQPRPARRVRPRACPQRAALRVGLRRRRDRRRARRHAPDRRGDDDQLQPARARPGRQQRGHAALHVGRADERPARRAHGDGRRPPDGRAARAQPRGLVRAHSRHQGARAGDGRGRPRHAARGAAGPDPVFIFEHALLYPLEDEIDEEPRAVDIARAAVRREGSDVTVVTYGGSLGKCLAAADSSQRRASVPR